MGKNSGGASRVGRGRPANFPAGVEYVGRDEYGRPIGRDEYGEFISATPESQRYYDRQSVRISTALRKISAETGEVENRIAGLSRRIGDAVARRYAGQRTIGDGRDLVRIAPGLRRQRAAAEGRLWTLNRRFDALVGERNRLNLNFQVELARSGRGR